MVVNGRFNDTRNIIIVDDHPILWEGLRLILEREEGLHVIQTARDGTEVFRGKALKFCDLIILDIGLPNMDGFSVLDKLREDHPGIPALVFTIHGGTEFFSRAMGRGARGFVLKQDPPEVLIAAVRGVLSGKLGISPSINPMSPGAQPPDDEHAEAVAALTPREREVLSLVAGGLSSRDIARSLNVKKSTVDKHREHIRAKLGTGNLAEWVNIARKYQILR